MAENIQKSHLLSLEKTNTHFIYVTLGYSCCYKNKNNNFLLDLDVMKILYNISLFLFD